MIVVLSIIITLLYLFLIGSFVYGFDRVKPVVSEDLPVKNKFSIIIPFRDEDKHLPNLLRSILALEYPRHAFEVIFVDDASSDESVDIIKHFSDNGVAIKLIKNNRSTASPKKDAITTAIKQAQYEWIVTTDADCILPKYWLDSFDFFIQRTNAACIVAPVIYSAHNNFLSRFQLLDVLSLQGATIGGFGIRRPFLCNGANLAYKVSLFNAVQGFSGNTNIASGDDVFLLEKAVKMFPDHVYYLKNNHAIVTTIPQETWSTLIAQRLRWAAKTGAYGNTLGTITGLLVFLMNALIVVLSLLVVSGLFNPKVFFYLLVIKFNIDFFLLYKTALFFDRKRVLRSYMISFLVYPYFSTYIAFIAAFSGYKWKGRTFKK